MPQGLHDAAVRECSEALKLKPDYLKVIIRRAQAYDKLDKQEEALAGDVIVRFLFEPKAERLLCGETSVGPLSARSSLVAAFYSLRALKDCLLKSFASPSLSGLHANK